ncbi:MAG: hypothetical protein R3B40_24000 [Polyangiales bacterium]|nr:hypothetical protein [Myxococcales bacterium]MCB9660008.1 hypothetical protein [Sandaracinaceae bacterium]
MKKSLWAVIISAIVAVPSLASAGYHYSSPVVINATSFAGTLHATRNTADNVSYLGCGVVSSTTGDFLLCHARTTTDSRSCMSSDPGLIANVRSITSSSYISVTHSGSTCTAISVVHLSYHLP